MNLNKLAVTCLGLVFSMSAIQCGSSSGTASTSTSTSTPTAEGTQTSAAVSSSVGSAVTSGVDATSSSESVQTAIKAARKSLTKKASTAFDESMTVNCSTSGSVTNSVSGTVDISGDTLTIDGEMSAEFDACVETASLTLEDDSTCNFGVTLDGGVTCTLDGSGNTATDAFNVAVECTTTAACSGLTVTVNGEAHTIGLDVSATATGDAEPEMTGTICVDGTTFNFEDIEEAEFSEDDGIVCD